MNNDNSDLNKLDKVFPYLNDIGKSNLSNCIPPEIEFSEVGLSCPNGERIIADLLQKYGYAKAEYDKNNQKYSVELTDKGRDAKVAGGHFSYLKQLAEKEQKRQNRKDRIDHVDFLMKSWSYKYRYLLYIASFGGLAVSIITCSKPEKEPKDLAPMKQELQEVKSKMKELDSLFRMDRLLKKDTIDIRRDQ
jgi:predicted transcriptional regulator